MGLGESDHPLIDNESTAIACSICLEIVAVSGDRSTAKLQCGHEFHLDCIGSAFNSKGLMQCPNCRNIEKGKWLYSNGSRSPPELSFDEWAHDEDLYDLSYSEMSFGVHWCPFSRIARVPSTFQYGSRLAGSFVSASIPPYTVSAQPHYQHHNSLFVGPRRPVATSGLPPVGPTPISLPDQTRYYLFPPTATSSRRLQDTESAGSWQTDPYAPFPLLPVERQSALWGPHPHSSSSSESRFLLRNGSSERPTSQGRMEASSYQPPHAHAISRTRPFI